MRKVSVWGIDIFNHFGYYKNDMDCRKNFAKGANARGAVLLILAFALVFAAGLAAAGAHAQISEPVSFSASASGTSVDLAWTAPAEASEQSVRYATSPVGEATWNSATPVAGVPAPVPNAAQSATVSGLAADTLYHFGYRYVTTVGEVGFAAVSATTGGGAPPADLFAPAPVTNLAANPGTTSVVLSWTAPSDTDLANYDARWGTSPITASNFASANVIGGTPLPVRDTSQNVTVNGLSPATTYYFAVKVFDTVGNESPIAAVSATTGASSGGGGSGGSGGGGGGGAGGSSGGGSSGGGGGGTPSGGGGSATPIYFVVNKGDVVTATTSVTLTVNASRATRMRFSNTNDFTSATWAPSGTTFPWRLEPGNGVKTVYADFVRDLPEFGVGAYEPLGTASDSILLDAPPEAPASAPATPPAAPASAPSAPRTFSSISLARDLQGFNALMVNWGAHGGIVPQDLNRDFAVNGGDVYEFLARWTVGEEKIGRAAFAREAFAGSTTMVLTPDNVRAAEGEEFTVTFLARPHAAHAYTAQIALAFPADVVELVSFTYGRGWVPVVREELDVSDNAQGVLVKTAGYPAGFSEETHFGTARFRMKKAGEGLLVFRDDGFALNAAGGDTLSYALGGGKIMAESRVPAPALFLANLLTLGRNGNTAPFLIVAFLLAVAYTRFRKSIRVPRLAAWLTFPLRRAGRQARLLQ